MANCGECYRRDICSHVYSSGDGSECAEYWQRGEWIPCSERMPDIAYQQIALIVSIEQDGRTALRTASYHVLKGIRPHWRCGGRELSQDLITAWQPFPTPYKLPTSSQQSKDNENIKVYRRGRRS